MIAFVACSKSKKGYPCIAEKMYTGILFKKSINYCKSNNYQIYILSAKYGILNLNDIITPYEKTLSKMSISERNNWYNLVKNQIKEKNIKEPYLFLTGKLYKGNLPGELLFGNLSFGKRLQWLNNNTQK